MAQKTRKATVTRIAVSSEMQEDGSYKTIIRLWFEDGSSYRKTLKEQNDIPKWYQFPELGEEVELKMDPTGSLILEVRRKSIHI